MAKGANVLQNLGHLLGKYRANKRDKKHDQLGDCFPVHTDVDGKMLRLDVVVIVRQLDDAIALCSAVDERMSDDKSEELSVVAFVSKLQ